MNAEVTSRLDLIRTVVKKHVDPVHMYLFGSRATGLAESDSDFDVLVVVPDGGSRRELMTIESRCRRELAAEFIDADILIRTESTVEDFRDKPGSIIRSALVEGVEM